MAHELPAADGESSLVRELTIKLEQLRAEKGQLQGLLESSLSNDLREQLLLLQRRQSQPQGHSRHRSSSSDVGSPSTSSSSSTGASFPSSPSLQNHSISPSFSDASFTALRSENDELRARLEASEMQREWANREVVELKRRLGMIQLDELEELDLASGGTETSRRPLGASGSASRERSNSRGNGWSSNGSNSNGAGGIRIPGAGTSSFSPPSSFAAARNSAFGGQRTSSSFSSRGGGYPHSRGSSLNTTLTTPSSSYPVTLPPPTSPASSSFNSRGGGFQAFLHHHPGSRAPPPSSISGLPSYQLNGSDSSFDADDLTPSRSSYADGLGEDDQEDGGLTPLSTSPGSRSGSLSRRTSFSVVQQCGSGSGSGSAGAGPGRQNEVATA
ncbi:hypothetical protein BCR35DRAFT_302201 [Leucosporidium creatinivorum]|uniref:Uncharacterized protein n=1 Tax=Leucosporidium creatinivorum TaxID=106004 RepID=A0A1Y2FTU5_9BASI|nr:hypothetical protein BCR35DRAFT_302201 [Leucosporidium creatinivorum]